MGDIINIGSLAPGQSKTIKCNYKALQSDMGKTNLVNKVDVSSGDLTVSASSAAANIEAVRYEWTMAKNLNNSPANGTAFIPDEEIIWSIPITNTGNQNLSVFPLTDSLSGAKITPYDFVPGLSIGSTFTAYAHYTVKDSDANSTITNTISGSYTVGSDKKTVSATAKPVSIGARKNPFDDLTWAQIKSESAAAVSNPNKYKDWLGFSKAFNISGIGTINAQLVALNNKRNSQYSNVGFTFMTEELVGLSRMSESSAAIWYGSTDVRTFLSNSILPNIESSLSSIIQTVSVECLAQVPTSTDTSFSYMTLSEKIWPPSYYELCGNREDTHGQEGNVFDLVKQDGFAASSLGKKLYNKTSKQSWWTRSPYINPQTGYAAFWGIGTMGGAGYYSLSTQSGVAFCFSV